MVVTLADLARATQLSVSTVSRAWSDPSKLNESTRKRILESAAELGYSRDSSQKAGRVGPGGSVGLIVPDIANPFFPPIIKAIQERARYRGKTVLLADTDEQAGEEFRLLRDLRERVDGVILVSARTPESDIDELASICPVVFVNRAVTGSPSVVIEDNSAIEQAVEHLIALGHKSICYLNGPKRSWSNDRRRLSVADTCQRHSIEFLEFGPFEPQIQAGVRAADLVLASPVTAVIAYDDLIALGLIARLTERGVVVGQGISVIGIDDSPMSGMAYPSLTSIHVPGAEAGTAAVDLLLSLLETPEQASPAPLQLESSLVLRGSTGLNAVSN